MRGLSHTAWLIQSKTLEIQSCEPTVFDVPQRGPWSRRRRTRWSNTQPECAIRELHELPRQDSRVAFTSGFLQVSYEKTKRSHLCNLWLPGVRVTRDGTTNLAQSGKQQRRAGSGRRKCR